MVLSTTKQPRFTLIELLVVIAIIAVLASLLLPVLNRVREQAKLAACASNQRQVYAALSLYSTDQDGQYPSTHAQPNTNPNSVYSPTDLYFSHGASVGPMQLGLLYSAGFLETPGVFYCPGELRGPHEQATYEPWPTPQWGYVRTAYYYNPYSTATSTGYGTRVYQRATQFPSDKIMLLDILWLDTTHPSVTIPDMTAHYPTFSWNTTRGDGSLLTVHPSMSDMLAFGPNWRTNNSQNWDTFYDALDLLR